MIIQAGDCFFFFTFFNSIINYDVDVPRRILKLFTFSQRRSHQKEKKKKTCYFTSIDEHKSMKLTRNNGFVFYVFGTPQTTPYVHAMPNTPYGVPCLQIMACTEFYEWERPVRISILTQNEQNQSFLFCFEWLWWFCSFQLFMKQFRWHFSPRRHRYIAFPNLEWRFSSLSLAKVFVCLLFFASIQCVPYATECRPPFSLKSYV